MNKRKHVFRDVYEKEFTDVKRSRKGVGYAYCCVCDSNISLEAMGKTAITAHITTGKHKKFSGSFALNQSMKNVFTNRSAPIHVDHNAAAAEGAWAFHTIKHQQSFLANDCTTHLIKAMFPDSDIAKKFVPARTNSANIITGVLAPYAQKVMLTELGKQPFSISVDAFYHNEEKLFPLVIRFFNATVGIRVRVLDLRLMPGETSEQIMNFIVSSTQGNDLDLRQLTSFCAENASVNFGGPNQDAQNNVFHRLKERTAHLIPIGCPSRILHNAAEEGTERLVVDLEMIVLKMCSHFKGKTSRVVRLKHFCAQLETSYSTLPAHTPTRWTTLDAVLKRMIDLWEPLKEYFLSLESPPRILESFFRSDESLVNVYFLHSALSIFKKPILLLQKTTALFPELANVIESFKCAILQRQDWEFFGATTAEMLKRIDKERAEVLQMSFQEFYRIVLDYINQWYRLEKHPVFIDWTLLKYRNVAYEEVREMAKQVDPQIAMADELFDEVAALNTLLEKIPDDIFNNDDPEKKWMKIFSENNSLPHLYRLISIIFSIPVSSAFEERAFSPVSAQWTKDGNQLNEKTIKALLQVRGNLDIACSDMHELISKDSELIKKIFYDEKN